MGKSTGEKYLNTTETQLIKRKLNGLFISLFKQQGKMDFDHFFDIFGHYFVNKKQKYGEIEFENTERDATCFICPSES